MEIAMTHTTHTLPWGKGKIELALPESWHVAASLAPAPVPAVEDVAGEVRRSLQTPVSSATLSALYRPGMKVALVVDDSSRPTPVAAIFPGVLAELQAAGMPREDLTLVSALGLHRAMLAAEMAQRTGLPGMQGWQWENHTCDDPQRLVYLGTTSRGTPVWINKTVAQAGLVVSIGCIEPHIIASFGGGYKNLIPGVAGRATTAHNHSLNCTPGTFNMVGQPIECNPMRLDLEEGGRMLKPPVFIVNAVLNSAAGVVRVVAGDPVAAHRAGCAVSAAMYGVNIARPADIVISDSYPMDSDFRQGVKAIANTVRAVRRGGVMIALVKAEEGVGVFGLADQKLPLGRRGLQLLAPALVRLVPRLKIKGLSEEDRFFLYFALQAMRHATLLMVAPTIPAETKAHLPFVQFVDSPEEAIRRARQRFPSQAEVLLFPYGGTTFPVLRQ
jgi:nickel-dependent lactate racemase